MLTALTLTLALSHDGRGDFQMGDIRVVLLQGGFQTRPYQVKGPVTIQCYDLERLADRSHRTDICPTR